ncbi:MAG: hypothetical protein HZB46_02830 [Solirubrobacterales bacterium]|nr:hypothetical protein [Solirubrobacterales bacterium]
MRRRPLVALAALLLLAPAAEAQQVNAPPGNSGITQYLEVVPNAGGNASTRGKRKDDATPLTRSEQRRLARRGTEGQALAAAIAKSADPAPSAGGTSSAKRNGKARPASAATTRAAATTQPASSSSSVAAALTSSGDEGGMGSWLPILMVASLLTVLVAVFARSRRRDAPGE